jgi:hypothetical protein
MKTDTVDRQAQLVRTLLAILGAALLATGWYRWISQ